MPQANEAPRLLTLPALRVLGILIARTTLLRLEAQNPPAFPRRIRVGRSVYWIESEILAYLDKLAAGRKGGAP